MSRVSSVGFLIKLKNLGLSYEEFTILPKSEQVNYYGSRIKRSLKRLDSQINKYNPIQRVYDNALKKSNYKIQKKAFILLPEHVGKTFQVYNGKQYIKLKITVNMIGKRIGMFIMCKKFPNHNKAKNKK